MMTRMLTTQTAVMTAKTSLPPPPPPTATTAEITMATMPSTMMGPRGGENDCGLAAKEHNK